MNESNIILYETDDGKINVDIVLICQALEGKSIGFQPYKSFQDLMYKIKEK